MDEKIDHQIAMVGRAVSRMSHSSFFGEIFLMVST